MKDALIRFTVSNDMKGKFKKYCTSKDTTMSNVLIDYIYTLLSKEGGKAPAREKNSVKKTAPTMAYHCPYCGKDITGLIPIDRLNHLQNCKNGHNR